MATRKSGTRNKPSRHMGGDGKEYNSGVKLTAKMTPEMQKRMQRRGKGK